ncbi:unnamed protein product [Cuscuta campestris]|uniref:Reverse transcriptase domain-containing protein n=1 Tax=Cuscuta campestris TaxID=132261 RepID=A0A484LGU1_9ASTE|nr:unnamed protein product [Cuscuta campestris]
MWQKQPDKYPSPTALSLSGFSSRENPLNIISYRGSMDDCLHNINPDLGLNPPGQGEGPSSSSYLDSGEYGTHSDDGKFEEIRDTSSVEPVNFRTPSKDSSSLSIPKTKKKKQSRGKVFRRLDRAVVNEVMLENYDDITVTHINSTTSDHKPVLLQCIKNNHDGPKPFRFFNIWLNHPNFMKTLKDFWSSQTCFGGMTGLAHKLKGLKVILKEWNKDVFGRVENNIKKAELIATSAQERFENDPSANKAKADLILATENEINYWKQKANINWMKEGDSNSNFFHSYVKGRRIKSTIRTIDNNNGDPINNSVEIQKLAVDHFSQLFCSKKNINLDPIKEYLEVRVTEADNLELTKVPTGEEIKEVVWNLNPDSAPGPDGFNGNFFKSCWDTVKEDIISASQEFFLGIPVPRSYGSTFLTLIPKKEDPKNFSDYRPISLSTFMSKINTKILANRLQKILPKIISFEQTGFQQNKGIEEQILLTEEMVHKIDNKTRGRNIIIKLDMAKAFDNMEWDFITFVLQSLGFSKKACDLLMANLFATHISILINGSPCGFFKMQRGVKQGDPLSPLLFIIASEGLSCILNQSMNKGIIHHYNTGRDLIVSHLGFADDIIIFTKGDGANLKKLVSLLKVYLDASGQVINYSKSRFYCGKKCSSSDINKMGRILGMQHGQIPFRYLGAPICKGILRKEDCKELINHFDFYLHNWFSKTLNQMGRVVLIKHVLSAIPLHILAVHTLPNSVINSIHRKMNNFLWGHNKDKPKYH